MAGSTRRILSAVVLAVAMAAAARADLLYLVNGEEEDGRLVRMTKQKIRFEGRDGVSVYPKREVLRIQLQRARLFDDVTTVEEITDPDLAAAVASQPGPKDHPAAGYVVLLERDTFDLTTPGIVVATKRLIVKVLRQRGEDVATQNVWYFEDCDRPRVDFALTVTPDGRVLHLNDTALKNESVYLQLPEYRRLARFRFACKEPRPGSILDMQYTVERRLAPAKAGGTLEPFYTTLLFRDEQPVLCKEVVVTTGVDQDPAFLAEGQDIADAFSAPIIDISDGRQRHRWNSTGAQRGITSEPHMPPLTAFVPRLTLGGRATWETVGTAYAAALAALAPLPAEWAARAKELAAEGGAEAIHNYVTRNIRLAPVPHWHYSVVPRPAGETLERGIANPLDKNFAYFQLLRAAGIDCNFALVRGRGDGPLPEQVPSLKGFKKSAVFLREEHHFSVAGQDTFDFHCIPGDLQDTMALLIEEEKAVLVKTSRVAPEQEWDATHFDGTLSAEGALELTVTYTSLGTTGAWLRGLKDMDDEQLRNQIQQIAGYLHPAAALKEYTVTDLADLRVTPELALHCTIPGYAVSAGPDIMMMRLPAVFYSAQDVGAPARDARLYWDNVVRETTTGTITLPKGFLAYSLPEDLHFDSCIPKSPFEGGFRGMSIVRYEAKTKAEGDTIAFRDQYDLEALEAPAEAYAVYKECREERARIPRQRIILMRE